MFEIMQELNQFGLIIYNTNLEQLVDIPGHECFSYLSRKDAAGLQEVYRDRLTKILIDSQDNQNVKPMI